MIVTIGNVVIFSRMILTKSENWAESIFLYAILALAAAVNTTSAQDRIYLINADRLVPVLIGQRNFDRFIGSVHYYNPERDLNIYCDTTDVFRDEGLFILRGNANIIDKEKSLKSDLIRYNDITEEARSPGFFTYYEFGSKSMLQANSGIYLLANDLLTADGNVAYSDSSGQLYADHIDYAQEEKKIFADGNVKYIDSEQNSVVLFADQATYLQEEKEIFASGNIRYVDYDQNAVTTAQTGRYIRKKEYGILSGNPQIAIADSGSSDSLYISGQMIEYFGGDTALVIVTDSVKIQKGNLKAVCRQATYNAALSLVYLRNEPKILQETTTISGDEIDLVVLDDTLTEVIVRDSAVALTDADSTGAYDLQNELRGKYISLFFKDEAIYKIVATHNAESVYYRFENNELLGKNISTSGKIVIFLENGYFQEGKGLNGVQGTFIPKNRLPEVIKKRVYE